MASSVANVSIITVMEAVAWGVASKMADKYTYIQLVSGVFEDKLIRQKHG